MSKIVAILQSNYIPWKGYFDLINRCDVFVLYDDMQYTKNDWRNRNKIQTKQGLKWLTIPVRQEKLSQRINETKISDARWSRKHWATITHNYTKAKYFNDYKGLFEDLYLNMQEQFLSEVNYRFIVAINKIIGIDTVLKKSSEFKLIQGKSERLLDICKTLGANVYLSGPTAMDYLDVQLFKQEGVDVVWMNYDNYRVYKQLHQPFEHGVSILDLIFNEGPESKNYLKNFDDE